MKMLSLCLLLLSSYAVANADDAVVKSSALAVKDRIQTLELINVTAQRPISETAEPLDAELEALLAEIAALEAEEAE